MVLSKKPQADNQRIEPPAPFWQIAFRPFFLVSTVFLALALTLWGLLLNQAYPSSLSGYQPYSGWLGWHSHEMIFGFVQGIAIGFLLTASRSWASQKGVNSLFIKLLIATWLGARLAWLIPNTPPALILFLDAITPLLAAAGLAKTLYDGEKKNGKGTQKHNWPFVLLLTSFALVQMLFHLLNTYQPQYISLLMKVAVLMMAAMTLWVSGRVLPFFTKARLQTPVITIPTPLKVLSMTASWLLIPALIVNQLFSDLVFVWILAGTAIIAAATHALSLLRMFRIGIKDEPMLWSLFLAYGWIIIGYALLASSLSDSATPVWLHAITIGGLLGMIISMMARISLGHTGRKIVALKGMSYAFLLIQIAAVMRISQVSLSGITISIVLIVLVLAIFLFHYTKILINPRGDGKFD